MPKQTATFTILHGDDDLRIDEEVARLHESMGDASTASLNTTELDGTTVDVGEVINSASAYPFLSDRRLVLVKDMLTWITRKGAGNTGKAAVEKLVNELPTLPDWARVVFIERQKLADTNKILQLAAKHDNGAVKTLTAPKDASDWIVKRAQDAYGTGIERQAASALASVTQNDLRRADNELVKLVSYLDGTHDITERDVALLTPYVAEANLFAMVDALAEGRGQAAATLLHKLIEQNEDPFSLYGMIIRQFRLLLLSKEHLAAGGYPAGISDAIGVHKFVGDKLAKQCRQFSLTQLETIYRALHDYDVKMKTGRIEPLLALDLLIAWVSQKGGAA